MELKNTAKVIIAGSEYVVSSEDSKEYIEMIAKQTDEAIAKLMKANPRLGSSAAAILCALDYCDRFHKADATADNLRAQINEYIKIASDARAVAEEYKKEIAALKNELEHIRQRAAQTPAKPDAPRSAGSEDAR